MVLCIDQSVCSIVISAIYFTILEVYNHQMSNIHTTCRCKYSQEIHIENSTDLMFVLQ